MSWLSPSPSGLSRIGFIVARGATPAASACAACARPISSPAGVTAAFSDMFCALKGATRQPSSRSTRQSAVAMTLLPTDDAVPCTITQAASAVTSAPPRPSARVARRRQGRRRERWTTRPRRSPRGEEHELGRERQLAGRPADIAGHAPQTRAREEADGQRDGRGGPDQGETGSEQKRQDDQRDQGGRNDEVDGSGGGTERRRKSLAAGGRERDERDR